jgi:2-oxoglutarate ferredoxin oxidoreductase subunit alpha
MPVLFLTDKWVGSSGFSSHPFIQDKIKIRTGKTILLDQDVSKIENYKRFELTDDGISPRAIPGLPKQLIYKTTGNEHDELGRVDDSGPNRLLQMDKRMRKLDKIAQDFPDPVVYGSSIEESDLTVISWGSNKGIILDTLDRLSKFNISFIHVTHIWPFPNEFMINAIDKSNITVVVEQNFDGQFGQLIRNKSMRGLDHTILRYDGRPFDPIDLAAKFEHIIKLSK